MPAYTSRLNLYKPGDGVSISPDEAADVSKINDNMDLIDDAVGAKVVTSGTRPASPYTGQVIYETDTQRSVVWNGSSWVGASGALEVDVETLQDRVTARPADFTALAALATGELLSGDAAYVTEGAVVMRWSGSAWVQQTQAVFATVADRDTAYAKASAAYRIVGARARVGRIPYLHSGSGWLVDGGYAVVDAQDFSGTTITIDSLPTDLNSFRLELSSRGTAASLTAILRTTAPADETGLKYDRTDLLGRNSVTSSSTVPSTASWALSSFSNTRHLHTLQISGLTQAVETIIDHSALVVSDPQVANTSNGKYVQALTHQDATAFGGLKLTFTASQTGRWALYGAV